MVETQETFYPYFYALIVVQQKTISYLLHYIEKMVKRESNSQSEEKLSVDRGYKK